MPVRTLVASIALALMAGCDGGDSFEVLVELRTDLVPGLELDRVRTELLTGLPGAMGVDTRAAEVPAVAGTSFALGGRVAEFGEVVPGSYVLRVQLVLGAGIVAERLVALDVSGTRAVAVVINRSCRGVRCPRASDPLDAISCVGGVCALPACATGVEEGCPARQCASAADCPPLAACASVDCVEGTCLYDADASACATGERCHPELGCVTETGCVPLAELCNGADDDCDTTIDESFDLDTNVDHCGACNERCSSANATPSCVSGRCALACALGYLDCNAAASDGCEASVTSRSSCGDCMTSCADTEVCVVDLSGAPRCARDCGGGGTKCSGTCADLTSSFANCGVCDYACSTANADQCADGTCRCGVMTPCAAGLNCCGGRCVTLDTATDCGACGNACAPGSDCCGGRCIDITSDRANCGACGIACFIPHGTAGCVGGSCSIGSCQSGWGNCNLSVADGCETYIAGDALNCGACRSMCGGDETCTGSRCTCGSVSAPVGGGAACRPPTPYCCGSCGSLPC